MAPTISRVLLTLITGCTIVDSILGGRDGSVSEDRVGFRSLIIYLDSPWLVHRDLYLTPRIVNLVISAIAVVAAYLLGRELFGRTAGLLTAVCLRFSLGTCGSGFPE